MEIKFERYQENPILGPDPNIPHQSAGAYNPSAVVRDGEVFLLYRAEDRNDISSICLAESGDGFNFESHSEPVIKPTAPEEENGCEDPRVTEIDGVYYLTYTAFQIDENDEAVISLNLAKSNDLKVWEKQGTMLPGMKAGCILPQPVNGEYLMLVGEGQIYIARSADLLSWKLDPKPLFRPRPDFFDSHLVEVGPPLIPLGDEFLMIYNSADNSNIYSPSYILLSRENPSQVLYRHPKPLLIPTEDYERKGKRKSVIFAEGLVEFNEKYFLYYGAADRYVAVATAKKPAD